MPYSDFTKQEYSDQDFLRLIEQRIRKDIRQHHAFDEKNIYKLAETTSLPAAILTHFLQHIFDGRLTIADQGDIIKTDYLEQYISSRLNVFLEATETSTLFENDIMPLRSVTGHELVELAKILAIDIPFEPLSHEVVDALANKYPQTKPSFLKSFTHIEQLPK